MFCWTTFHLMVYKVNDEYQTKQPSAPTFTPRTPLVLYTTKCKNKPQTQTDTWNFHVKKLFLETKLPASSWTWGWKLSTALEQLPASSWRRGWKLSCYVGRASSLLHETRLKALSCTGRASSLLLETRLKALMQQRSNFASFTAGMRLVPTWSTHDHMI